MLGFNCLNYLLEFLGISLKSEIEGKIEMLSKNWYQQVR